MSLCSEKTKWPLPDFDDNEQPHFLFIITPPYSGSTALAKILNTSNRTMLLTQRGEGQFLIPGLYEGNRWDSTREINYLSIKAVWLHRYQQIKQMNPKINVVIEKSPPNMIRIEKIASLFNDVSFIANNRNPYANCASMLYRKFETAKHDTNQRKLILEMLANFWINRSDTIRKLIAKHAIPLLTYEQFCQDPTVVIKILNLPVGVSESINPFAKVKVKDYEIQGIQDQNDRQISHLKSEDIECISRILKPFSELLQFFGYRIMNV